MLYVLKSDFKFKSEFLVKNSFFKRIKKYLLIGSSNKSGHNMYGRITVFTKGGRIFKKIRKIDFKRIIFSKGIIVSKERNWIHTGYIGCICYFVGLCSYIILPENYFVRDIWKGFGRFDTSNTSFLKNYKIGKKLNNIEIVVGHGAKLSRAAGVSSFIYSKIKNNIILKLKSGKLIKVSEYCIGSIGRVSNSLHKYARKKNAGVNRHLGNKPKVRGVAMNPVDHPHGGGEGKKSQKALPRTPWGKPSKWIKTRKKKNVKI